MILIVKMYVTLLPAILAGVMNMVWCKLPILKKLAVPMDANKTLKDGKRILGDNKTWKGFAGYIILNIILSILWGVTCKNTKLNNYNFFYVSHQNTFYYNLLIGFLIGLFYALFELPNSFLKRRLNIEPGKTKSGFKKYFFIFLDQADSIFGVCLVVALFYKLGIGFYFLYVLIGAFTHIVFNVLLYFLKLRKNMF